VPSWLFVIRFIVSISGRAEVRLKQSITSFLAASLRDLARSTTVSLTSFSVLLFSYRDQAVF